MVELIYSTPPFDFFLQFVIRNLKFVIGLLFSLLLRRAFDAGGDAPCGEFLRLVAVKVFDKIIKLVEKFVRLVVSRELAADGFAARA